MKIKKERSHFHNFKNVLRNYFAFYNKNLRKKHIVLYIISLLIFAFFMITFIKNLTEVNQFLSEVKTASEKTNIFMTVLKGRIPLIAIIVASGITPYIYIPLIAIAGFPYLLATELMNLSTINMIIACIGSVIQIFGVSLAVAAGIYYCTSSTKKFRYNQSITFGIDDVKKQIYETTKKEDKLNKLNDKMKNKSDKREKLNVKIEYKALVITAVISMIIVATAALITGV